MWGKVPQYKSNIPHTTIVPQKHGVWSGIYSIVSFFLISFVCASMDFNPELCLASDYLQIRNARICILIIQFTYDFLHNRKRPRAIIENMHPFVFLFMLVLIKSTISFTYVPPGKLMQHPHRNLEWSFGPQQESSPSSDPYAK